MRRAGVAKSRSRHKAVAAARAELVAAAREMGGNTVSTLEKSQGEKVVLLGMIYQCGP